MYPKTAEDVQGKSKGPSYDRLTRATPCHTHLDWDVIWGLRPVPSTVESLWPGGILISHPNLHERVYWLQKMYRSRRCPLSEVPPAIMLLILGSPRSVAYNLSDRTRSVVTIASDRAQVAPASLLFHISCYIISSAIATCGVRRRWLLIRHI